MSAARISRVLIANRGEIAVRIIKTCKAMGIETVVAVSEADKESLAARVADHAICIGPSRPEDSYLRVETIIAAAIGTKADAIHPGYGFLAERPELAEGCSRYGLIFVGPNAEAIKQMGNKLAARKIATECGVPVVPGSGRISDYNEAVRTAKEIGFPILIKAAAGGGGRGMRIVYDPEEFRVAYEAAANEARAAFGDDTLYLERYVANARHVEVQVIGDREGNVIHLGERDCSLQRRYQKVIEEAPAPYLPEHVRKRIRSAAVTIAKKIHYENAGTVEFILDQDTGEFYFLEMNTRIQVEHPVTEMITGVDLVEQQILVAEGRPLSLSQDQIHLNGHAIECRINAESPRRGFQPSPGRVTYWAPPQGSGVRVDTHCYQGYTIPLYYDSLLAKVVTHGSDRREAVNLMQHALKDFRIGGIETTVPFLSFIVQHPDYVNYNGINVRWLENTLQQINQTSFGNGKE